MPKKFQGENSKAVVARTRKAEKAAQEKAQKEKLAADEYWRDDDKHINKKLQRKEDKEKKKQEEVLRKKEKKLLEEEEDKTNQSLQPSKPQKVTIYELEKQKEAAAAKKIKEETEKGANNISHLDAPLVENLNLLQPDVISASGIDAAVSALSMNETSTPDRHPERRMAAAFKAFEDQRLPQLKKENPSMRLSQLKQQLRKEWQKSPQNPLNQRVMS